MSCSNEDSQNEVSPIEENEDVPPKRIKVGVYYFGGWSGLNASSEDPNEQDWAKGQPTHLTKNLFYEFSDREPEWGWRDDSLTIMERQIDLAADHGIDFFMFCWYWSNDKEGIAKEKIDNSSLHKCIDLYLRASNRERLKFGILIANHNGAEILGDENWTSPIKYLAKYLGHEQYIKIDNKPYLSIFNANGLDQQGREIMQQTAVNEKLGNLSIVACGSSPNSKGNEYRSHYNAIPVGDNEGEPEKDYTHLIEVTEKEWVVSKQPYIPTVSVGWDPRPWDDMKSNGIKNGNGWYYVNNTPEKFKGSLLRAAEWIEANPEATVKERMVMIYAWNEFGEGGYLVPNKSNNKGEHLDMIKEVVFSNPLED